LRRLYNQFYGGIHPQLISHYWIPNWYGDKVDSSARKLDIFNAEAEDKKLDQSTHEFKYQPFKK
jgi:hypothetical protein